jgi:E3 ubiquitin-protein ligase HUWE1
MDNASFLISLTPELRAEVLLTADAAFLETLPPDLVAEAQLTRERAARQWQSREMVQSAQPEPPEDEGLDLYAALGIQRGRRGDRAERDTSREARNVVYANGLMSLSADDVDESLLPARVVLALMKVMHAAEWNVESHYMDGIIGNLCKSPTLRNFISRLFTARLTEEKTVMEALVHGLQAKASDIFVSTADGGASSASKGGLHVSKNRKSACLQLDSGESIAGLSQVECLRLLSVLHSFSSNPVMILEWLVPRKSVCGEPEKVEEIREEAKDRTDGDQNAGDEDAKGEAKAAKGEEAVPSSGDVGGGGLALGATDVGPEKVSGVGSARTEESTNSLLESIINLFASPYICGNSADLLRLASIVDRISAPLDSYVEDAKLPPLEDDKARGLVSRRIPEVRLSGSSLRGICDVFSSDVCSKAAYDHVLKIIVRLSRVPANANVLTDQILEVFGEVATDTESRLTALQNTLDNIIPKDKPDSTALKLSPSKLPLSIPGGRQYERMHRSLQTLEIVCHKTGRFFLNVAPMEVLGRMWTTLEKVLSLLKLFLVEDDENKMETSRRPGMHRPQSTLTSLVTRLLPVIEAFFIMHSHDLSIESPGSVPASGPTDATRSNRGVDSAAAETSDSSSTPATQPIDVQLSSNQSPAPAPAPAPVQRHPSQIMPGERYRTSSRYASYNLSLVLPTDAGLEERSSLTSMMSPGLGRDPSGASGATVGQAGVSMNLSRTRSLHSMSSFTRFSLADSTPQGRSARLLSFVLSHKGLINLLIRSRPQLLEKSMSVLIRVVQLRSCLVFDIKRTYFFSRLKQIRNERHINRQSVHLNLRRDRVFEDSFHQLRMRTATEMQGRLRINFYGEEGVDAGGLTREWFCILAREIFNPNYVLFTAASDGATFQPNPLSMINTNHLDYFKFVGRVIGKAICDQQLMDAHFTRSFYKHLLGMAVDYNDIEAIEPDYFKSLKQILDMPLDMLGLELTFSAEANTFGKYEVVDLIPNGRNVAVTDENKPEYVRLIAHHRMTSAIRAQIDSFLEGFYDLVPPELVSIFSPTELELLICGLPDVDLDDLQANTEYHQYRDNEDVILWFWETLRGFSREERALFLQFLTGTSKVPLEGFSQLQVHVISQYTY